MIPRGCLVLFAFLPAPIYAQNATAPSVTLDGTGTVIGVTNTTTRLDTFLGIPYAQPPVGDLRFAAPKALSNDPSRVIRATKYGPVCPQQPSTTFPISVMSEDCLTINVFRPAGLNSTAKLPVLVWIFGGSFVSGGSPAFNPAVLIGQSELMREPIIYVSFNYRVNLFGFITSTEVAAAAKNGTATLNAGLHDQQAALLWVQQNIQAFGGDPDKVTVFGESAGAMSIGSHLVADGGKAVKKLNLFRAAIMESGAPSGFGVPPPGYVDPAYQSLATIVGCGASLANETGLACLRSVSTGSLLNAALVILSGSTQALPFNRVLDGYFHNMAPSVQVRAKKVATIPVMIGTNLDEGTGFVSTGVNNSDQVAPYLIKNLYDKAASPDFQNKLIPRLLILYPDIPDLGSPYNPVNVSKDFRFYGPTNQYKRLASIYGDALFQSGRRLLLDAYIAMDECYPAYNYLFTANTPGAAPARGVYHGSEIPFVYGQYALQNATSPLGKTSGFMMSAWIAFANTLQPDRAYLPEWPKYGEGRATLQIGPQAKSNAVTLVIKDDFRKAGIRFLQSAQWTKEIDV